MNFKKKAFSMAELLITLALVGTVSVLMITSINLNIMKKVYLKQARAIKYKIGKATENMAVMGKMKPYASTEAFLDEFQKYIKINKRCTVNNLEDCWGSNTNITIVNTTRTGTQSENTEYDVLNLTTGTKFMKPTNIAASIDFSSPTSAVVFADGAYMILGYNKLCTKMCPKTYSWMVTEGIPMFSETSVCMTGLIDVNGAKGPNKVGADLILFNANGIGENCAIANSGVCLAAPIQAPSITKSECENLKDALGINECDSEPDFWAGCVKTCGGKNNVASRSDALYLYDVLYGLAVRDYSEDRDHSWNVISVKSYAGEFESYGFPSQNSMWYMWTNDEVSGSAVFVRQFQPRVSYAKERFSRSSEAIYCICKGNSNN